MTLMCDLDPDVVRWGLHLIDVCSLANNGSPQIVTCYVEDMSKNDTLKEEFCSKVESVLENDSSLANNGSPQIVTCYVEDMSKTDTLKEEFCSKVEPVVENDKAIAQALQEELSRLDQLGSLSSGEQHQKESILAQDWRGPSGRHFSSECPSNVKEVERKLEEVSTVSQNQERLPEIENDSIIDGELGKRLNQLVPIPHVPKINGEIPSFDEATSDHQRLLDRLQMYELVELKISGDGNCQFRSLSDQIYRTSEHHKFVREQVVNQLKLRPDLYENYVPMAYGEYIKKMSKNGEWGDHVTLQAASDWFGIKMFVVTSFEDTCYIEILPQTVQKSNRIIFLSFWAEVHYNSIYPLGELPEVENKRKKRWWW